MAVTIAPSEHLELEVHAFSHRGGRPQNQDVLRQAQSAGNWTAVLCDGLGGSAGGAAAASFCAEQLLATLTSLSAADPAGIAAALEEEHRRLRDQQAQNPQWRQARCTAAALLVRGAQAAWGNVGDTRICHFTKAHLATISPDDSVAWQAWRRGEIDFSAIRLDERRTVLTSCMGDQGDVSPHQAAAVLQPGDALMLCSDGFWVFVTELEAEVELCKSRTAEDWCERMLLRHARRSHLDGDNLSILVCRVRDPREEPNHGH